MTMHCRKTNTVCIFEDGVLVDEILERHLRLPCLQWLHSVLSNEMFIEEDFSLMVKF